MKQLVATFLGLGLMVNALQVSVAAPTNIDELLEQVKRERVLEQQQNKLREAEFLEARDQQARLLREARAALASEEARTASLSEQFEQNEGLIIDKEAQLQEKSGSLGELFGSVRQMVNDSRSVLENSMTSLQNRERIEQLNALAERQQQPTIDDLHLLWLSFQEEMTASGKVVRFATDIINASGAIESREVIRVGVFTAFSDGKFLRYLPETGNLVELARQPVPRLRDIANSFENADAASVQPVVIDPTRGAIMALLVQTPSMQERINQGGWIGYIILGLGVIGLLLAIQRFVYLVSVQRRVNQQQKTSETSQNNPLGRILSVYSDELANDVETLSLKLDEAILRETPTIERGLVTLAILAAIAPMLGLLGTVSGMIETFQSITLFGTSDPKLMSGGISQALVTTQLGLAVAIPLLLMHSALSSKSNRLIQILDEESAAIVARNAEKQHGLTEQ